MLLLTSRARGSVNFSHKSQSSKRDGRNFVSTQHLDLEVCRNLGHLRDQPTSRLCNIESLEVTLKLLHQVIEARAMQVPQTNPEALYPMQKKYVIIAATQGI